MEGQILLGELLRCQGAQAAARSNSVVIAGGRCTTYRHRRAVDAADVLGIGL